jgi:hypothetical protein
MGWELGSLSPKYPKYPRGSPRIVHPTRSISSYYPKLTQTADALFDGGFRTEWYLCLP